MPFGHPAYPTPHPSASWGATVDAKLTAVGAVYRQLTLSNPCAPNWLAEGVWGA